MNVGKQIEEVRQIFRSANETARENRQRLERMNAILDEHKKERNNNDR